MWLFPVTTATEKNVENLCIRLGEIVKNNAAIKRKIDDVNDEHDNEADGMARNKKHKTNNDNYKYGYLISKSYWSRQMINGPFKMDCLQKCCKTQ